MDEKTEKFRKLFNQLEEILAQISGKSKYDTFISKLNSACRNSGRLNVMRSKIDWMTDLRNVLIHEDKFVDKSEIAIPCEWVIEELENIIKSLTNPQNAFDIATRNIYSCNPNDFIAKVIREMSAKTFTHVPVISDNQFLGLLTESAILAWLGDKAVDDGFILEEKTIKELEKYYKNGTINDHYQFIPRDMDVFEVKERFTDFIKDGKRLGVLFVTQNGKAGEGILGMVTAWDLGKIK